LIASNQSSSVEQEGNSASSTGEQRKPLVLLPRTLPTNTNVESQQTSTKTTSIFGTGKPRDITKPEIKQLEEKVEKILTLQSKPSHVHSHSESSNASANGGGSTTSNPYNKEDRLRTTSTTSSNNSNNK
jgi:hypothetical protein